MFNAINRLLYKKGDVDGDTIHEFTPYMATRYLSFYDKDLLKYANDTVNRYGGVFSDSVEQFEFFDNVIPKLKYKKIAYIKKKKETEKEESEINVPEFYSKRELTYLNS